MNEISQILYSMAKVSDDIWTKGWCEANGGNISLRLTREEGEQLSMLSSDWLSLEAAFPGLAGEIFAVSGSGKYIRNISLDLESTTGVIRLDETGSHYQIIRGFEDGSKPTSELRAHLGVHELRKELTGGTDRAVIHTHTPNLISLSYTEELSSEYLTKLIWKMHAECVVVFPDGIGYLPWLMAGSNEIAEQTRKLFEIHRIILWQYHGVFATGKDFDEAFGLIDTAEKTAGIYLKCLAAGGVRQAFTEEQTAMIARNFSVTPIYNLH